MGQDNEAAGAPVAPLDHYYIGGVGTEYEWRQCRYCHGYVAGPIGHRDKKHHDGCPVAELEALRAAGAARPQPLHVVTVNPRELVPVAEALERMRASATRVLAGTGKRTTAYALAATIIDQIEVIETTVSEQQAVAKDQLAAVDARRSHPLDLVRAAMIRAMNALESDNEPDARREAFEMIQEQFEGVSQADCARAEALIPMLRNNLAPPAGAGKEPPA